MSRTTSHVGQYVSASIVVKMGIDSMILEGWDEQTKRMSHIETRLGDSDHVYLFDLINSTMSRH
jgi:hypothetical protein